MTTKRKQRIPPVIKVALFCFALYAAVSLVRLQLQIGGRLERIAQLDVALQQHTAQNAVLRASVEQGASDEQIAAIAREKLGYAFPQERVFVDASSK